MKFARLFLSLFLLLPLQVAHGCDCFVPCWDPSNGCSCGDNSYYPTSVVQVVIGQQGVQFFIPSDSSGVDDSVAGIPSGNTLGALLQLGYSYGQDPSGNVVNPFANTQGILSGDYAVWAGGTSTNVRAPKINYAVAYLGNILGPIQWKDVRDSDFMGTNYLDFINGRVPSGPNVSTVTATQASDWDVPAGTQYSSWSVTSSYQIGSCWCNCVNWLIVIAIALVVLGGFITGVVGVSLLVGVLIAVVLIGAASGVGAISNHYQSLSGQSCTHGCYIAYTQYTFYMVYPAGGVAMDETLPNVDVASSLAIAPDGNLDSRHYVGPVTKDGPSNLPVIRSVRGTFVNLGDSRVDPAAGTGEIALHVLPPGTPQYLSNFPLYGVEVQN
jgi:hypothetical protein